MTAAMRHPQMKVKAWGGEWWRRRCARGGHDASEGVPKLVEHGSNLLVGLIGGVSCVGSHQRIAEVLLPVLATKGTIHIRIVDDRPGLHQSLLGCKDAWV